MNAPPIRIGISAKPTPRQSTQTHWRIENRTVAIDELTEAIQAGHALGAIVRGRHVAENVLGRQDIQIDVDQDIDHPLLYWQNHPFVKQHAYLVYTTRTAGHVRIVFRLSEQITNPAKYARYARALAQKLGGDLAATSISQLWYTQPGCEVLIVGQTIPFDVLESLLPTYDPEPRTAETVSHSPDELLQIAIDAGQPGNRHAAGFHLALELRSLNMPHDAAKRILLEYQAAVATRGADRGLEPYTQNEALTTLRGLYRTRRRAAQNAKIERARQAILKGEVTLPVVNKATGEITQRPLPVNVRRSAFAYLAALEQIGRTDNVELSLRQIIRAADWHIERTTIMRHMALLARAGLCHIFGGTNGRPTIYTLTWQSTPTLTIDNSRVSATHQEGWEGAGTPDNPYPSWCVANSRLSQAFEGLQKTALAESNAKIHASLTTSEADLTARFGSSAQAIIAALAGMADETADSIETLQQAALLSWRCTSRTVRSLAEAEIVEVVKVGRCKAIKLRQMWQEKIADLEPRLTTYGRDVLRAARALDQREGYHDYVSETAKTEQERAEHAALADRARAERAGINLQIAAAMEARRDAAQRAGLNPASVPDLGDDGREHEPTIRQPVVEIRKGKAITRYLIPKPTAAIIKPNRKLRTERADYIPPLPTEQPEIYPCEPPEWLADDADDWRQPAVIERTTLGSIWADDFGQVERIEVHA